jgi:hypothetical protein
MVTKMMVVSCTLVTLMEMKMQVIWGREVRRKIRRGRTWRVKRNRAHHFVRTSGMLKEARKLL